MPYLIPFARRALRRASVLGLLLPSTLVAQRQGGVLVGRVLAGDVAVPGATIVAQKQPGLQEGVHVTAAPSASPMPAS